MELKKYPIEKSNIVINNTIDSSMSLGIIKDINAYQYEYNEVFDENNLVLETVGLPKMEYKPSLQVHLNTFGGCAYNGFAIYDRINKFEHSTVICQGAVMSCGILILLSGKERLAYPNTTFMIHGIRSGAFGKLPEMKEDVKETERLQGMYKRVILENTNILQEKLEEVFEKQQNWYIDTKEALELGLIHKIIE